MIECSLIKCPQIIELKEELDFCSNSKDSDITGIHAEIRQLQNDMAVLRSDVHQISAAVSGINDNLTKIANVMQHLSDLPETWESIKGWWRVMRFLKDNVFILVILFGGIAYSITQGFL